MKRTIVAAVAAALVLAGCASTKPIWFIATPGYVDARIAASESALQADYDRKLAEKDARIRALETELASQKAVAEGLAALADVIARLDQSNQELRGIASAAQERIELMPVETLELLIQVLTDYLESAGQPAN